MKYYRLLDNLGDRWFLSKIRFQKGHSIWDFVKTGRIPDLGYVPELKVSSKGEKVNVTFSDFDILIVDSLARSFFPGSDVQFFPVKVTGEGEKNQNYCLMTIVNEIDCLDEQESEFDVFKQDDEVRPDLAGTYRGIYKMVIDPSKVEGADIFRLKNYHVAVIVSEKLKKELVKNKVTGIKFKQV